MSAIAWIGLIGALIAGTQAWIAHRKLRLDLFDKRFQAYEDMSDAINDRFSDITRSDRQEKPDIDLDILKRFWKHQRKLKLLYPFEVSNAVDKIEKLLLACDSAYMNLKFNNRIGLYEDKDEFMIKYETWLRSQQEIIKAQNELGDAVHIYVHQYGLDEIMFAQISRIVDRRRNLIHKFNIKIRSRSNKST